MGKEELAKKLSPLALAYLGDGVLEVMVREHLLEKGKVKINDLHCSAVNYVSAKAQGLFYDYIEDFLTEEELDVLKRGRNAKKLVPKNANVISYRKSTGVEAVFGYLWMLDRVERLKEIAEKLFLMVEEEKNATC